jgi:hypothetical protein
VVRASKIRMSSGADVVRLLKGNRLPLTSEAELQDAIEEKLKSASVEYEREYILDAANRADFMLTGIVVEVKIGGSARNIYRQCERYSTFEQVREICLVTNRAMGFPADLNGKPCYVLNLGQAWL